MNDGGFGGTGTVHPTLPIACMESDSGTVGIKTKLFGFFFSRKNSLNFVPKPQGLNGAVTGNRTLDLLITNEVLYR